MGFNKIKSNSAISYILNEENSFKRGITVQREIFKTAKLENDYDQMCDALENIKSEIKHKVEAKGLKEEYRTADSILEEYRNLENRYTRNTPDGKKVVWPDDIHKKLNKMLTSAYEVIMEMLYNLNLL